MNGQAEGGGAQRTSPGLVDVAATWATIIASVAPSGPPPHRWRRLILGRRPSAPASGRHVFRCCQTAFQEIVERGWSVGLIVRGKVRVLIPQCRKVAVGRQPVTPVIPLQGFPGSVVFMRNPRPSGKAMIRQQLH